MARYLTSNTLIESAIRKASIPVAQVTFKEEDFLAFANEEMDVAVVPYVLSFHEDYFLFPTDVTLVDNQSKYEIPYRAIGNKLREVSYKDPSKNLFEMTRISVEDISYYQNHTRLSAFYVENNEICVFPENNFSNIGSLRMWYYIRPNQLVAEDRAMIVRGINRTTGQITVDNVPSIYSIGSLVDLIKVKSPHKCIAIDTSITDVDTTNNVITLALVDIPSSLVVGDHICLAEECIIPQIPTDIHSLLAQRVACRCLEAMGDQQGLQAANAKLAELELKLGSVIDSRVEGAPLKLVNRHSTLQTVRKYYRR